MTDAVGTVIWQWGSTRMGVRRILATASGGNKGSVRVFEKNGFMLTKTVENCIEHTGTMRNLHMLKWDINAVQSRKSIFDSTQLQTRMVLYDFIHVKYNTYCHGQ
jgi:RimJ/RimL family protein N-acetyltransferase